MIFVTIYTDIVMILLFRNKEEPGLASLLAFQGLVCRTLFQRAFLQLNTWVSLKVNLRNSRYVEVRSYFFYLFIYFIILLFCHYFYYCC